MKKLHLKVTELLTAVGYDSRRVHCTERHRWWTRGDGARYKDKDTVDVYNENVENVFDRLEQHDGSFNCYITGEFASTGLYPAISINNVIFILAGTTIEIASVSILRNSSVWKISNRETATRNIISGIYELHV
jgi:hypothetical protein